MSLFRSSGRLEAKLAKNNDPMKQKRLWVKSFTVRRCWPHWACFSSWRWTAALPYSDACCSARPPLSLWMVW